jgi:hypothetical protein
MMASATLGWYHIWARTTSHAYDTSGSPRGVGNVTRRRIEKALSP